MTAQTTTKRRRAMGRPPFAPRTYVYLRHYDGVTLRSVGKLTVYAPARDVRRAVERALTAEFAR